VDIPSLTQTWSRLWLPKERLSLSEWSERNFILSSEYSARSGPIKLFQYQRDVFDAFTDPTVEELILMCTLVSLMPCGLNAMNCLTGSCVRVAKIFCSSFNRPILNPAPFQLKKAFMHRNQEFTETGDTPRCRSSIIRCFTSRSVSQPVNALNASPYHARVLVVTFFEVLLSRTNSEAVPLLRTSFLAIR
jgi:hypothetical protein